MSSLPDTMYRLDVFQAGIVNLGCFELQLALVSLVKQVLLDVQLPGH